MISVCHFMSRVRTVVMQAHRVTQTATPLTLFAAQPSLWTLAMKIRTALTSVASSHLSLLSPVSLLFHMPHPELIVKDYKEDRGLGCIIWKIYHTEMFICRCLKNLDVCISIVKVLAGLAGSLRWKVLSKTQPVWSITFKTDLYEYCMHALYSPGGSRRILNEYKSVI